MKKMIAIGVLCFAGAVFAQEQTAPVAAAPAATCECKAGKPCTCGDKCACGEGCPCCAKKGPAARRHPGEGRRGGPKYKKCACSPDCQGIILLPPDAEEGEPLFKLLAEQRGGRGPGAGKGSKGPRGKGHGKGPHRGKGPEGGDRRPPAPPAGDAPASAE